MVFLQVMSLLCLVLILYQDLRYKAVYWICFPVLTILLFALKYITTSMINVFTDAFYSLTFFLLQLFLLWVYFSFKNKQLINITNNHLGWGDILFLVAITFYLSPGNYILFYVFSLMLVLIYAICSTYKSENEKSKHIPLAGLQAALLGVAMVLDFCSPAITLYSDHWIYILIA